MSNQGTGATDAWDNQWTSLTGWNNNKYRITGSYSTSGLIWYHQGFGVYDLNNINSPISVQPIAWQPATSTNPCSMLPSDGQKISEIVEDSIDYEYWPETYRFTDRAYVYKLFCEDSLLRTSNTDYLAFYENESQGNLEVFRTVEDMMSYELYADALDYLNSNLVTNNFIEENLYYTLNLQLEKYLADDETYTEEETGMLMYIANLIPMEGGPGVYYARAMLNLEVNNPALMLRMANSAKKIIEEKLLIYPNPSKGIIHVTNAENSIIKIIDATGRTVTYVKNKPIINLENCANGIYYLTITNSNGEISRNKIVLKK